MKIFPTTPLEMFNSILRNRNLIKVLAMREIQSRYRGTYFGLLWSFFLPIFMLAVFTFVFSVIFQARWGGGGNTQLEFALLLFSGLLVFNLFSECINRAPVLILSNVNYVKKVVFPLEVLPVVSLMAGLFHALISFLVWILAYFVFFGMPHFTVFFLPFVLMPFCLILLGLSWTLASLGVFLRDISQIINVIITALMFLSPIFYPVSAFPDDYHYILYLNPITTVVEQTRDVLFWGKMPNILLLGELWMVSMVISWLGFVWFQRTREGFADVI